MTTPDLDFAPSFQPHGFVSHNSMSGDLVIKCDPIGQTSGLKLTLCLGNKHGPIGGDYNPHGSRTYEFTTTLTSKKEVADEIVQLFNANPLPNVTAKIGANDHTVTFTRVGRVVTAVDKFDVTDVIQITDTATGLDNNGNFTGNKVLDPYTHVSLTGSSDIATINNLTATSDIDDLQDASGNHAFYQHIRVATNKTEIVQPDWTNSNDGVTTIGDGANQLTFSDYFYVEKEAKYTIQDSNWGGHLLPYRISGQNRNNILGIATEMTKNNDNTSTITVIFNNITYSLSGSAYIRRQNPQDGGFFSKSAGWSLVEGSEKFTLRHRHSAPPFVAYLKKNVFSAQHTTKFYALPDMTALASHFASDEQTAKYTIPGHKYKNVLNNTKLTDNTDATNVYYQNVLKNWATKDYYLPPSIDSNTGSSPSNLNTYFKIHLNKQSNNKFTSEAPGTNSGNLVVPYVKQNDYFAVVPIITNGDETDSTKPCAGVAFRVENDVPKFDMYIKPATDLSPHTQGSTSDVGTLTFLLHTDTLDSQDDVTKVKQDTGNALFAETAPNLAFTNSDTEHKVGFVDFNSQGEDFSFVIDNTASESVLPTSSNSTLLNANTVLAAGNIPTLRTMPVLDVGTISPANALHAIVTPGTSSVSVDGTKLTFLLRRNNNDPLPDLDGGKIRLSVTTNYDENEMASKFVGHDNGDSDASQRPSNATATVTFTHFLQAVHGKITSPESDTDAIKESAFNVRSDSTCRVIEPTIQQGVGSSSVITAIDANGDPDTAHGVIAGMRVRGTTVYEGTTVTSVSGAVITLDRSIDTSANQTGLSFARDRLADIQLTDPGQIDEGVNNEYLVGIAASQSVSGELKVNGFALDDVHTINSTAHGFANDTYLLIEGGVYHGTADLDPLTRGVVKVTNSSDNSFQISIMRQDESAIQFGSNGAVTFENLQLFDDSSGGTVTMRAIDLDGLKHLGKARLIACTSSDGNHAAGSNLAISGGADLAGKRVCIEATSSGRTITCQGSRRVLGEVNGDGSLITLDSSAQGGADITLGGSGNILVHEVAADANADAHINVMRTDMSTSSGAPQYQVFYSPGAFPNTDTDAVIENNVYAVRRLNNSAIAGGDGFHFAIPFPILDPNQSTADANEGIHVLRTDMWLRTTISHGTEGIARSSGLDTVAVHDNDVGEYIHIGNIQNYFKVPNATLVSNIKHTFGASGSQTVVNSNQYNRITLTANNTGNILTADAALPANNAGEEYYAFVEDVANALTIPQQSTLSAGNGVNEHTLSPKGGVALANGVLAEQAKIGYVTVAVDNNLHTHSVASDGFEYKLVQTGTNADPGDDAKLLVKKTTNWSTLSAGTQFDLSFRANGADDITDGVTFTVKALTSALTIEAIDKVPLTKIAIQSADCREEFTLGSLVTQGTGENEITGLLHTALVGAAETFLFVQYVDDPNDPENSVPEAPTNSNDVFVNSSNITVKKLNSTQQVVATITLIPDQNVPPTHFNLTLAGVTYGPRAWSTGLQFSTDATATTIESGGSAEGDNYPIKYHNMVLCYRITGDERHGLSIGNLNVRHTNRNLLSTDLANSDNKSGKYMDPDVSSQIQYSDTDASDETVKDTGKFDSIFRHQALLEVDANDISTAQDYYKLNIAGQEISATATAANANAVAAAMVAAVRAFRDNAANSGTNVGNAANSFTINHNANPAVDAPSPIIRIQSRNPFKIFNASTDGGSTVAWVKDHTTNDDLVTASPAQPNTNSAMRVDVEGYATRTTDGNNSIVLKVSSEKDFHTNVASLNVSLTTAGADAFAFKDTQTTADYTGYDGNHGTITGSITLVERQNLKISSDCVAFRGVNGGSTEAEDDLASTNNNSTLLDTSGVTIDNSGQTNQITISSVSTAMDGTTLQFRRNYKDAGASVDKLILNSINISNRATGFNSFSVGGVKNQPKTETAIVTFNVVSNFKYDVDAFDAWTFGTITADQTGSVTGKDVTQNMGITATYTDESNNIWPRLDFASDDNGKALNDKHLKIMIQPIAHLTLSDLPDGTILAADTAVSAGNAAGTVVEEVTGTANQDVVKVALTGHTPFVAGTITIGGTDYTASNVAEQGWPSKIETKSAADTYTDRLADQTVRNGNATAIGQNNLAITDVTEVYVPVTPLNDVFTLRLVQDKELGCTGGMAKDGDNISNAGVTTTTGAAVTDTVYPEMKVQVVDTKMAVTPNVDGGVGNTFGGHYESVHTTWTLTGDNMALADAPATEPSQGQIVQFTADDGTIRKGTVHQYASGTRTISLVAGHNMAAAGTPHTLYIGMLHLNMDRSYFKSSGTDTDITFDFHTNYPVELIGKSYRLHADRSGMTEFGTGVGDIRHICSVTQTAVNATASGATDGPGIQLKVTGLVDGTFADGYAAIHAGRDGSKRCSRKFPFHGFYQVNGAGNQMEGTTSVKTMFWHLQVTGMDAQSKIGAISRVYNVNDTDGDTTLKSKPRQKTDDATSGFTGVEGDVATETNGNEDGIAQTYAFTFASTGAKPLFAGPENKIDDLDSHQFNATGKNSGFTMCKLTVNYTLPADAKKGRYLPAAGTEDGQWQLETPLLIQHRKEDNTIIRYEVGGAGAKPNKVTNGKILILLDSKGEKYQTVDGSGDVTVDVNANNARSVTTDSFINISNSYMPAVQINETTAPTIKFPNGTEYILTMTLGAGGLSAAQTDGAEVKQNATNAGELVTLGTLVGDHDAGATKIVVQMGSKGLFSTDADVKVGTADAVNLSTISYASLNRVDTPAQFNGSMEFPGIDDTYNLGAKEYTFADGVTLTVPQHSDISEQGKTDHNVEFLPYSIQAGKSNAVAEPWQSADGAQLIRSHQVDSNSYTTAGDLNITTDGIFRQFLRWTLVPFATHELGDSDDNTLLNYLKEALKDDGATVGDDATTQGCAKILKITGTGPNGVAKANAVLGGTNEFAAEVDVFLGFAASFKTTGATKKEYNTRATTTNVHVKSASGQHNPAVGDSVSVTLNNGAKVEGTVTAQALASAYTHKTLSLANAAGWGADATAHVQTITIPANSDTSTWGGDARTRVDTVTVGAVADWGVTAPVAATSTLTVGARAVLSLNHPLAAYATAGLTNKFIKNSSGAVGQMVAGANTSETLTLKQVTGTFAANDELFFGDSAVSATTPLTINETVDAHHAITFLKPNTGVAENNATDKPPTAATHDLTFSGVEASGTETSATASFTCHAIAGAYANASDAHTLTLNFDNSDVVMGDFVPDQAENWNNGLSADDTATAIAGLLNDINGVSAAADAATVTVTRTSSDFTIKATAANVLNIITGMQNTTATSTGSASANGFTMQAYNLAAETVTIQVGGESAQFKIAKSSPTTDNNAAFTTNAALATAVIDHFNNATNAAAAGISGAAVGASADEVTFTQTNGTNFTVAVTDPDNYVSADGTTTDGIPAVLTITLEGTAHSVTLEAGDDTANKVASRVADTYGEWTAAANGATVTFTRTGNNSTTDFSIAFAGSAITAFHITGDGNATSTDTTNGTPSALQGHNIKILGDPVTQVGDEEAVEDADYVLKVANDDGSGASDTQVDVTVALLAADTAIVTAEKIANAINSAVSGSNDVTDIAAANTGSNVVTLTGPADGANIYVQLHAAGNVQGIVTDVADNANTAATNGTEEVGVDLVVGFGAGNAATFALSATGSITTRQQLRDRLAAAFAGNNEAGVTNGASLNLTTNGAVIATPTDTTITITSTVAQGTAGVLDGNTILGTVGGNASNIVTSNPANAPTTTYAAGNTKSVTLSVNGGEDLTFKVAKPNQGHTSNQATGATQVATSVNDLVASIAATINATALGATANANIVRITNNANGTMVAPVFGASTTGIVPEVDAAGSGAVAYDNGSTTYGVTVGSASATFACQAVAADYANKDSVHRITVAGTNVDFTPSALATWGPGFATATITATALATAIDANIANVTATSDEAGNVTIKKSGGVDNFSMEAPAAAGARKTVAGTLTTIATNDAVSTTDASGKGYTMAPSHSETFNIGRVTADGVHTTAASLASAIATAFNGAKGGDTGTKSASVVADVVHLFNTGGSMDVAIAAPAAGTSPAAAATAINTQSTITIPATNFSAAANNKAIGTLLTQGSVTGRLVTALNGAAETALHVEYLDNNQVINPTTLFTNLADIVMDSVNYTPVASTDVAHINLAHTVSIDLSSNASLDQTDLAHVTIAGGADYNLVDHGTESTGTGFLKIGTEQVLLGSGTNTFSLGPAAKAEANHEIQATAAAGADGRLSRMWSLAAPDATPAVYGPCINISNNGVRPITNSNAFAQGIEISASNATTAAHNLNAHMNLTVLPTDPTNWIGSTASNPTTLTVDVFSRFNVGGTDVVQRDESAQTWKIRLDNSDQFQPQIHVVGSKQTAGGFGDHTDSGASILQSMGFSAGNSGSAATVNSSLSLGLLDEILPIKHATAGATFIGSGYRSAPVLEHVIDLAASGIPQSTITIEETDFSTGDPYVAGAHVTQGSLTGLLVTALNGVETAIVVKYVDNLTDKKSVMPTTLFTNTAPIEIAVDSTDITETPTSVIPDSGTAVQHASTEGIPIPAAADYAALKVNDKVRYNFDSNNGTGILTNDTEYFVKSKDDDNTRITVALTAGGDAVALGVGTATGTLTVNPTMSMENAFRNVDKGNVHLLDLDSADIYTAGTAADNQNANTLRSIETNTDTGAVTATVSTDVATGFYLMVATSNLTAKGTFAMSNINGVYEQTAAKTLTRRYGHNPVTMAWNHANGHASDIATDTSVMLYGPLKENAGAPTYAGEKDLAMGPTLNIQQNGVCIMGLDADTGQMGINAVVTITLSAAMTAGETYTVTIDGLECSVQATAAENTVALSVAALKKVLNQKVHEYSTSNTGLDNIQYEIGDVANGVTITRTNDSIRYKANDKLNGISDAPLAETVVEGSIGKSYAMVVDVYDVPVFAWRQKMTDMASVYQPDTTSLPTTIHSTKNDTASDGSNHICRAANLQYLKSGNVNYITPVTSGSTTMEVLVAGGSASQHVKVTRLGTSSSQ